MKRHLGLLLAPLLAAACGGSAEPLERDEFVDVYVALRHAAIADSASFAHARDSILAARGVTVQELEHFIASAQPATLSDAWIEIAERLETPDSLSVDSAAAQEPAG